MWLRVKERRKSEQETNLAVKHSFWLSLIFKIKWHSHLSRIMFENMTQYYFYKMCNYGIMKCSVCDQGIEGFVIEFLRQRWFPVNFVKFYKMYFLYNTFAWLLQNAGLYMVIIFICMYWILRHMGWQRYIQNNVKHLRCSFFAEIVKDIQPSTIFAENSISDGWQGSKYTYGMLSVYSLFPKYMGKYLPSHQH